MIHIATWKRVLVILVCVLGIVYAVPNLLPQDQVDEWSESLPSWMPVNQINLGLDLQGGSHLLLRVDYQSVIAERMEGIADEIRTQFRQEDIGFTGLEVGTDGVALTVRDPAQAETAAELIRAMDESVAVSVGEEGALSVAYTEAAVAEVQNNSVIQSIEIIRRRIDAFGTTEPIIQRQGDDRIVVQVPGAEDPEQIKNRLTTTARLTFHLIDQSTTVAEAQAGQVPAGSELLPSRELNEAGEPAGYYVVRRRVMVSGDTLTDAQPTFDQNNTPAVSFRFDSTGARRFADTTSENVGGLLAIVLDDEVISAPRINSPILGGQGIIEGGGFTVESANELAVLLRAGALPADIEVLEERTVGPGLGQDSIDAGQVAAVIGLVLVVVFMILVYGLFGVFAVIALAFNLAIIIAALTALQATLTLPGIAGIVLTVGMAVDANVLIFERIREEVRNGRSPISAIDAGYNRAFTTIVDSNLTTLIAAILLFSMGAGPVRGFSVTLSIGILSSMFTAIMVTRLFVVTWLLRTRPKVLNV